MTFCNTENLQCNPLGGKPCGLNKKDFGVLKYANDIHIKTAKLRSEGKSN